MADSNSSQPSGHPDLRQGPKLRTEDANTMVGVSASEVKGATWRGWTLGLGLVVLQCILLPHLDMMLSRTVLTNSLFPASSVLYVFLFVLGINAGLAALKTQFGLTRQDLIMVFCMTMLTNAIPGCGFMAFWVPTVVAGKYYATAENNWAVFLQYVPPEWTMTDTEGSRPIEQFYTGLNPMPDTFVGRMRAIPWQAWIGPFTIWVTAILMLFGMMFAICGLLRRQWAEHERLTFPLAQLPEDLVSGIDANHPKPFFKDKMAWWGIGLVLALYSLNHLAVYYPQIPQIELQGGIDKYLTERPWNSLVPVWTSIYISIVGLSYLLSLEVSFSVWFYFWVHKLICFILVGMGMADSGWYWWGDGPGYKSIFRSQGTGALLMLVLLGFWMARRELKRSLWQAMGLQESDGKDEEASPRALWSMLIVCFFGSVAWLVYFGVSVFYAVPLVVLLMMILTGLTRLLCEGGLFFMQFYEFPARLLQTAVPPSALGAETFVRISIWDRVMVADWFRVAFMPVVMNSLHLATRTGLKRRSVMLGMGAAVFVALFVSFGSVLYLGYSEGAAANMQWYFKDEWFLHKPKTYQVQQIEAYEKKVAQTEGPLAAEDVPEIARRDWILIVGEFFGAGFLLLSVWLRSFIFWFPHPIGYVMWMANYPHYQVWFSFFIGWMLKAAILKYGGSRAYLHARRLFIGLVVGEALGVIIWKVVFWYTGETSGFAMLPG